MEMQLEANEARPVRAAASCGRGCAVLARLTPSLFRVMTSLIFIVAGAGHLLNPAVHAARLGHAPLGAWLAAAFPANALIVAAGVPLLAGGLALAAGWRTRAAAALLLAVLLPITLATHVGAGSEAVGPLLKNVALLGALLHFLSPAPAAARCAV
jgi:putative oxidoreductase